MNDTAVLNQEDLKPLVKATSSELAVAQDDYKERQARVSANLLIATDHVFTNALSQFASYVDSKGDHASSPGGMKTQINKRIKLGYGLQR